MIVEAFFGELSAASAFAAIAGDRLYPSLAPQGTTLPFATYSMDADESDPLLDGTESSLHFAYISLDCYSPSYLEAHRLADAARAVLINFSGEMGSLSPPQMVDAVRQARPHFDLFESDTKLYRVSLQFAIAYYP